MSKNVLERMKENDSENKIAMFKVKQQQDYTFKRKYARIRAWEFYNHPGTSFWTPSAASAP